jgi:hypothetical protein
MVPQFNIAIISTLCLALAVPPSWTAQGNCNCDSAKIVKSCCGTALVAKPQSDWCCGNSQLRSSQQDAAHECRLSCECSASDSALHMAFAPTWESSKSSLFHASFVAFLRKDAYQSPVVYSTDSHSPPKQSHFRQALLCVWII